MLKMDADFAERAERAIKDGRQAVATLGANAARPR